MRAGVWNEDFDVPRLKAAGAPVSGRVYDYMKLWKHLQPNLPTKLKCRSLEFVTPFYWHTAEPWKHLSHGQPEFYNACDAVALGKCGDGIERDLKAKGQWDLMERHVVDCYQVLTRMAANGLPYDKVRAAEFEQELTTKYDERHRTLQEVVPIELKRPKQKEGYKKPPTGDDVRVSGLQLRTFHVLGKDMTKEEVATCGLALVNEFDIYDVSRYCLVEPFNPGSPGEAGQVADLVRHYGHKVGTNRKTKKGTVDDDTLKKLQRRLRSITQAPGRRVRWRVADGARVPPAQEGAGDLHWWVATGTRWSHPLDTRLLGTHVPHQLAPSQHQRHHSGQGGGVCRKWIQEVCCYSSEGVYYLKPTGEVLRLSSSAGSQEMLTTCASLGLAYIPLWLRICWAARLIFNGRIVIYRPASAK